MNKLSTFLLAALSVVTINTTLISTAAADNGLYIGAGVYLADIDAAGIDGDETTTAFFLGYTFIDSILFMASIEAGYYDLGDFGSSDVEAEIDAYTVAAVLNLPIGPMFEIYGKAGVAFIDAEVSVGPIDLSDDSEEIFYGVGASFDILDTIDIYAEYLLFDNDVDSKVAGIGVRLAF
ncbi:MAG: opacity protein-like surface antigen [Oceanicoccus sp.]|jgi:opacity protein-like surface antigen